MSVYMTEEEQLEAIKKWWQRHRGVITLVASVLLLVIATTKYWYWHQGKIHQQASNAYEHLMLAFSNQDDKTVRAYANQLIHEYGGTVYADAARLTLAKLFVARHQYEAAQKHLQHLIEHSNMTALQQVAKIRIARIMLAQKSYDKALAELSRVLDTAYMPVVNELKGDIYVATKHYPKAILSYQTAMNEAKTKSMGNLFLEMKMNEVASLTHSMR